MAVLAEEVVAGGAPEGGAAGELEDLDRRGGLVEDGVAEGPAEELHEEDET